MALTKSRGWHITAECASTPSRSDTHPATPIQLRPDKPDRNAVGKRIDAVPTAAMAVTRWRELVQKHARSGRMVVR